MDAMPPSGRASRSRLVGRPRGDAAAYQAASTQTSPPGPAGLSRPLVRDNPDSPEPSSSLGAGPSRRVRPATRRHWRSEHIDHWTDRLAVTVGTRSALPSTAPAPTSVTGDLGGQRRQGVLDDGWSGGLRIGSPGAFQRPRSDRRHAQPRRHLTGRAIRLDLPRRSRSGLGCAPNYDSRATRPSSTSSSGRV